MLIQGHGVSLDLPTGWEGEIYTQTDVDEPVSGLPVLHASDFPLPADHRDADFGQAVIPTIQSNGKFFSLVEFWPDVVAQRNVINPSSSGSYASPILRPSGYKFQPVGIPATVAGAAYRASKTIGDLPPSNVPVASQKLFNASGRMFCLYRVIGSAANAEIKAQRINDVVASLEVEPAVHIFGDTLIQLSPSPQFGSGSVSGTFSGSGAGECLFFASGGGASSAIDCETTITGTYSGTVCSAPVTLTGSYEAELADGRSYQAGMKIEIPAFNAQSLVAEFQLTTQTLSLPVPCILNGGTCSSTTSVRANLTAFLLEDELQT